MKSGKKKPQGGEGQPVSTLHSGLRGFLNLGLQPHGFLVSAGTKRKKRGILQVMGPSPPQGSLFCSNHLLLFFDAWLLIMFPLAQLCQYSRLLAQLFKAPDSALDGLVVSNPDPRHI